MSGELHFPLSDLEGNIHLPRGDLHTTGDVEAASDDVPESSSDVRFPTERVTECE
jgi:hypothetical protein